MRCIRLRRYTVDEFEVAALSEDAEVVPRAELTAIADEFFRGELSPKRL